MIINGQSKNNIVTPQPPSPTADSEWCILLNY